MHDIGRTQPGVMGEMGVYGSQEYEYQPEYEYTPEYEAFEMEGPGLYGEFYGEGPLTEAQEMELAAELLEITTEEELDQFLGKLLKKIRRSPIGRTLGGALKGVAKNFLPIAGAALGNIVAPGIGGMIGGQLASTAGKAFGLELEGMSQEDQEFEVARRFVRLADEAASTAAAAPPTAPPQAVAQNALASAAQKHAPGLVARRPVRRAGGTWRRQGRTIVLYGV